MEKTEEMRGMGSEARGIKPNGIEQGLQGTGEDARGTEKKVVQPSPTDAPVFAQRQQSLANVWATQVGIFKLPKESEWTHVFNQMGSLKKLVEKLKEGKLQRRVAKLAIVAHGDTAGLVQLDSDMTSTNVTSFRLDLADLIDYLTPNGKLIFMSCIAGAGKEGDELLSTISSYLPGRYGLGLLQTCAGTCHSPL